ncbi:hypothetical protein WS58_16495 [Burkholderia pseudomultivorans]|uniref:hypothetical protein n=1 Tax=Burkholderia pseudomultivorans TaxID=1207504 RepID=UPI000759EABD|nr:hypothetical protein [Burkholderia pseudomultivorans]AOI94079.1 hypothetical protein WS57_34700 [Burkholderia pseudomultivorans]KVC27765.1 hypothetical protein WS55_12865 [Burkholderia pseudomultivorans]KVC36887.1 hypothetical protein WS56_00235 [Burkholderia pseudomultivorans]KVC42128.1 hypothetical protein WS58_16495 [Burkholderia pseudomultivorans]
MSKSVLVQVRARLVEDRRMSDLSDDDEADLAQLLDVIDDALIAFRDNTTSVVDEYGKTPMARPTVTLAYTVFHLEDNKVREWVSSSWRQLTDAGILM